MYVCKYLICMSLAETKNESFRHVYPVELAYNNNNNTRWLSYGINTYHLYQVFARAFKP